MWVLRRTKPATQEMGVQTKVPTKSKGNMTTTTGGGRVGSRGPPARRGRPRGPPKNSRAHATVAPVESPPTDVAVASIGSQSTNATAAPVGQTSNNANPVPTLARETYGTNAGSPVPIVLSRGPKPPVITPPAILLHKLAPRKVNAVGQGANLVRRGGNPQDPGPLSSPCQKTNYARPTSL